METRDFKIDINSKGAGEAETQGVPAVLRHRYGGEYISHRTDAVCAGNTEIVAMGTAMMGTFNRHL